MAAGNSARNSGPIIRELWKEWRERNCPDGRIIDKTVQYFIANGRRKQGEPPAGLKPEEKEYWPIKVPGEKTVLGWVGGSCGDQDCRLVSKQYRSAARWLFFEDRQDDGRLDKLKKAWEDDDKTKNQRSADDKRPPTPEPTARWMPDLMPPDPLAPASGNRRMVEFTIHPSLESDPPNKPTVLVSLASGWINGRLDATETTPQVFYRMTATKLEIQPDHRHAVRIKGTVRLPFGTRWLFHRKPNDNQPLLDCERLEQVEVMRPAPLVFTVFSPRDGLKATAIGRPVGCSDTDLRVLERVLEQWGLDPAAAEVILAHGRLLPPDWSE